MDDYGYQYSIDKVKQDEKDKTSLIECLDTDKCFSVEKSVAFDFHHLARQTITTNLNSPVFEIGDTIFADMQQY